MTIDQFFELYKNSENVSFRKNESKVFNLSGINTPVRKYALAFNYNGGTFKLYYEDFFNPPPGLTAYGGRQLCNLSCSFPIEEKIFDFYIEKSGLIARIFKAVPDKYFIVKTIDEELLSDLLSNEHLITIYKIAEQSSLSPSINGKSHPANPNKYEITVSFGATIFESKVLISAIEFCKKMIDSKCNR